MAKSGRNPDEFALHSTTSAVGEDMAERVIQKEERWRSDVYNVCSRNNIDDSTRVSRNLARTKMARARQPGE